MGNVRLALCFEVVKWKYKMIPYLNNMAYPSKKVSLTVLDPLSLVIRSIEVTGGAFIDSNIVDTYQVDPREYEDQKWAIDFLPTTSVGYANIYVDGEFVRADREAPFSLCGEQGGQALACNSLIMPGVHNIEIELHDSVMDVTLTFTLHLEILPEFSPQIVKFVQVLAKQWNSN